MKTTRRGWLTAISSLIALPLLPKSGSASAESPPAARSLAEQFIGLPYGDGSKSRPGMEFWEETVRVPVTACQLRSREEFLRDSLHHLRTQRAKYHVIRPLESELRDIDLARTILSQLPTGRPLTFRYANGSSPGLSRTILPTLIFQTEPPFPTDQDILGEMTPADFHESRRLYLQAYCLERLAPRTFRLDRIQNPTPLG